MIGTELNGTSRWISISIIKAHYCGCIKVVLILLLGEFFLQPVIESPHSMELQVLQKRLPAQVNPILTITAMLEFSRKRQKEILPYHFISEDEIGVHCSP